MPIRYQNRIVAYIDILGFTEMIKQTDNENDPINSSKKLNIIYGIVASIQKYFDSVKNQRGLKDNCSITMFSDLIVFSQPQTESAGVIAMFDVLKRLQINMLEKNILIRGSIVHGKLIHKDNLIIGPALINAYNVENKSAVYPRIVIDPKVVNLYMRKGGKQLGVERIKDYDYEFTFSDDFDGTYYIDYFNFVEEYLPNSNSNKYYGKMMEIIKKGKQSNDTGIRMKYLWMGEKLKEVIEFNEREKIKKDFI